MNRRQKIFLLAPSLALALFVVGDRLSPLERGAPALAERYPAGQRLCVFAFWSFGPSGRQKSRVFFVAPDSGRRLRAMVVSETEEDVEVHESGPAFAAVGFFWLVMIGSGVAQARRGSGSRSQRPERLADRQRH